MMMMKKYNIGGIDMINEYEHPEIRLTELFLSGFLCQSQIDMVFEVDEYNAYDEESVMG